jgi:hypothetical protein
MPSRLFLELTDTTYEKATKFKVTEINLARRNANVHPASGSPRPRDTLTKNNN